MVVRFLVPGAVLAIAFVAVAGIADAQPGGRPLEEQLRYIGRDYATGQPALVDDRFIAEVERSIERYGKDEQEPVPPPPVTGLDIARLRIPALGVDAPVARYGLDRYGRLDVPQDTTTVGWNPGFTSLPGKDGATFLAAHYELGGVPGVFFAIASLSAGEIVTVVLSDGGEHAYRVTSVIDYALGAIDMGALLAGREGIESLTLMTCSGPSDGGDYAFRTVVLAERADER